MIRTQCAPLRISNRIISSVCKWHNWQTINYWLTIGCCHLSVFLLFFFFFLFECYLKWKLTLHSKHHPVQLIWSFLVKKFMLCQVSWCMSNLLYLGEILQVFWWRFSLFSLLVIWALSAFFKIKPCLFVCLSIWFNSVVYFRNCL